MAFRVEPTLSAKLDLDEILTWLKEHEAGDSGLRWFLKMQEAVYSLTRLPLRCPLAPESTVFPFEVRQLVFGRKPHQYRILFTIDGDTVVVLHVRHGRRLPFSNV
jgi:plasmid stabilization system protein ParE